MSNQSEMTYEAPKNLIINLYTTVAFVYCSSFAYIFFYIAHLNFLGWVHALAAIQVLTSYFLLKITSNTTLFTTVILTAGTYVVTSLFATGGWESSGYLWPFAYLPYAFFLARGKQVSRWAYILFGLCLFLLFLHLFGVYYLPYSPVQLFNYFVALSIFCFCMLLFQDTQHKTELLSLQRNIALRLSNESLANEVSQNVKSTVALEKRSAEIETLNDFLVDRELKMIAVQKENEQLKKDLKKFGISNKPASSKKDIKK